MSLWDDFENDYAYEFDYPFGIPDTTRKDVIWTTKKGCKIPLSQMSDSHITNCMKLVGEDDAWYAVFAKELKRREKAEKQLKDIIKSKRK